MSLDLDEEPETLGLFSDRIPAQLKLQLGNDTEMRKNDLKIPAYENVCTF